ncbi:hypothetical protein ACFWMR_27525 [Amycolatopsis thailandensis]|uniref:Ig-like domain-containing protein n=1 Tax=Amycolatopsis thailandensis TaxID=589330 RepID=A0A229S9A1_9PSEU|nr:hypothetical protein [Amycolatopsis thailandensis]OXM55488.1 hypothetical protein CFP71_17480 [Amycolatopsis thailandensis]
MKRAILFTAGTVAGLLLLAPSAVLATSPSPAGNAKPLSLSPAKGRPGDQIRLNFRCDSGPKVSSSALAVDRVKWSATVKNIKPGKYPVTLTCRGRKSTVIFTVLAKQVAKVPTGAVRAGGE